MEFSLINKTLKFGILINESGLRCCWIRLVANPNKKTRGKNKSVSLGMDDGDDEDDDGDQKSDCEMSNKDSTNSDCNVLAEMSAEYSAAAATWDVSGLKSPQLSLWQQTLAVNDAKLIMDIYKRLTGKNPPSVAGSKPLTAQAVLTPTKSTKSSQKEQTLPLIATAVFLIMVIEKPPDLETT